MLVEIIVVGREILTGKTLDTNSNYLARRLTELTFRVKRIVAVDDVVEEIAQEILNSIKYGVKLIITTGGLGPTFDDKTLEAISVATGRRLILNEEALKIVKERYQKFYEEGVVKSPEITPEREKMARLPDGSIPLYNPVGAAPGIMLNLSGCTIVSLPGVPKEMKEMFESFIVPQLEKLKKSESKRFVAEKTVRSGLNDESLLAKIVNEVRMAFPDVYIKSLPEKFGKEVDIEVRFTAEAETEEVAKKKLEKAIEAFYKLIDKRKGLTKGDDCSN